MPKARLVPIDKIPLYKLIEENMESIALGGKQETLLAKYMRYEKEEDELKEFLKQCILKTPPDISRLFQIALEKLLKIDKVQDEIIEDIWNAARRIELINALSNKLLKKYDVRGKYRKHRKMRTPLFGEV